MRKLLLGAAGLAALALATGSLGVASGAPGRSGPRETSFTVIQRAPDVASIDLEDAGPSPGDVLVFRSALFDRTNTERVGELNITCTQSFGVHHICRGIFSFSGEGRLSVDALPQFPNATTGIVNGGSGKFRLARGDIDIHPRADGTTRVTFHLS